MVVCVGAVLTAQEIEQLKGKLEHVSATLQEKEKERLKKAKVSHSLLTPS